MLSIENESFNVLKNRGYHLEHNFGHGKEHLAALLACFNLVAFAIHTVCDLASGAWRHARETLGPRTGFGAQFGWWAQSGRWTRFQAMRCDTGIPSRVIRLSTAQPTRASVFWAGRVRARRLRPMTAL